MKRFAPAKVNLGLSVLALRGDGYHELHSLMVPLSVGDDLTYTPGDGPFVLDVVGADLPGDGSNLAHRAALAYFGAVGRPATGHLRLDKALPIASGLGGGSSDAASTLLLLRELFPAEVDLARIARTLGADVPFFLPGGAAVAEGVGERLTPVTVPETHLVLVNPGTPVSARDAYRWLDDEDGFTGPLDLDAIFDALAARREVPYFNALEGPVVAHHPEIREVLATLRSAGLRSPLMSGSGATCLALANDAAHAARVAGALRDAHPGWWITAARSA